MFVLPASRLKSRFKTLPPEPPALLEVPDVPQAASWDCGAAVVMSVCRFHGVGPEDVLDYHRPLGTTPGRGTPPPNIVAYLTSLGLQVEERHSMSLADLQRCWKQGLPVLTPIQDYGTPKGKRELESGHWVVVLGAGLGHVFIQDPSEDWVLDDHGSEAAPGRVVIEENDFLEAWADKDGEGNLYQNYGIVVGPPKVVADLLRGVKAHPAQREITESLLVRTKGYSPTELQRAERVDLVTLPEGVSGTNCGNCQYQSKGFCTHPEVQLKVTPRQCCCEWNAEGTYRSWEREGVGVKSFTQGDHVRITSGEYSGRTGVVYGNNVPQHGAVGTPRSRFGEPQIRVQIDGFPKPGGWNGQVTVKESLLERKALSAFSDNSGGALVAPPKQRGEKMARKPKKPDEPAWQREARIKDWKRQQYGWVVYTPGPEPSGYVVQVNHAFAIIAETTPDKHAARKYQFEDAFELLQLFKRHHRQGHVEYVGPPHPDEKSLAAPAQNKGMSLTGKSLVPPRVKALPSLVKAGFTGSKRDKLGRTRCYRDGVIIPCGKLSQREPPQSAAQQREDRIAHEADNKVETQKGEAAAKGETIEQVTLKRAQENYQELRDQYLKNGGGVFDEKGNLTSVVLNTDDWRPLFPEYKGTNAGDVHEASSLLNKKLFAEALDGMRGKGNNTMVVLAGGGGSGKSGFGKFFDEKAYPVRLDQVSDNVEKLEGKINEARAKGFKIDYVFVDRPPKYAWLGGVVARALNLRKKGELARTVRLQDALKANIEARKTALVLLKKGTDFPVRILDNTGGFENARIITDRDEAIAHLEAQTYDYDSLLKELTDETRGLLQQGKIPEDIARGLIPE